MKISVCVICFNEEKNIRRCLESISWADEIVVVDSMSEDNTVEIAEEYTNMIFQRPWTGYVDQKNFALSKAHGDWILSVDADEEITQFLRDEILAKIVKHDAKEGYKIPRRSYYLGRWINNSGFYPDRQLRLFRHGRGRWVGQRVHEQVQIQGGIGDLRNDLLHYPYNGVISGQVQTVDRFSSLMAEDMYEKGKRYHLSLLILRPFFKFIEVYFLELGFLDGMAGLVIAVNSAHAMFLRYAKLREIEHRLGKNTSM